MKRKEIAVITALVSLTIVLSLSGCAMFANIQIPGMSKTVQQDDVITGTVLIEKNTYLINERTTGNLYTLIGISKDQKEALTGLQGEVIRVKVDVVSNPSPGNYNAHLIQIL